MKAFTQFLTPYPYQQKMISPMFWFRPPVESRARSSVAARLGPPQHPAPLFSGNVANINSTELLCTVMQCNTLECTALQCIALYCWTEVHCSGLQSNALHWIALHCTRLHCTVVHCTVLYWTGMYIIFLHFTKQLLNADVFESYFKFVILQYYKELTFCQYYELSRIPYFKYPTSAHPILKVCLCGFSANSL